MNSNTKTTKSQEKKISHVTFLLPKSKDKKKILKETKRKKNTKIQIMADIIAIAMEAKRHWDNRLKMMKGRKTTC